MITKPILAAKEPKIDVLLRAMKYPLLSTPKLDGIRCLVVGGKALTRRFKDVPNHHIRQQISQLPNGLDGEIVIPGKSFNEIQSLVMSRDGTPDFEYHVFDYVKDSLTKPYKDRIEDLKQLELPSFCVKVLPTLVSNEEELLKFEEQMLDQGYEGVMTRTVDSPYKCNRATLREGYLTAIKRFVDSEARVTGFEELLHNANELGKNELGYAKRASNKENLVPAGTLGVLLGVDVHTGLEIRIGTFKGLKDEDKQHIWDNQAEYLGKIVTYAYQEHGMKDKPRIPSFKGWRSEEDMS